MTVLYSVIRFDTNIGPVQGSLASAAFATSEGYSITRDGDTVIISHANGKTHHVPWNRVVHALEAEREARVNSFMQSQPRDDEPEAAFSADHLMEQAETTPADSKRSKGGWPKGKPRKARDTEAAPAPEEEP